MPNKKGAARERELCNLLDDLGWAVMRAPASGSATERELPDVLFGNGNVFYACEAKASNGNPIYLTEKEVTALKFFSEKFGAVPLIGTRWDYDTEWYYFLPEQLYRTDAGSYRVKKEKAVEDGATTDELWTGLESNYTEFVDERSSSANQMQSDDDYSNGSEVSA